MTEKMPQSTLDQIVSQIPMKRLGQPSEIARTALFLADPQASFITGETIWSMAVTTCCNCIWLVISVSFGSQKMLTYKYTLRYLGYQTPRNPSPIFRYSG
jgi:hypothetical protein